jgi:hypothetical protein
MLKEERENFEVGDGGVMESEDWRLFVLIVLVKNNRAMKRRSNLG